MIIERSDWHTLVLGPYDGDIADSTFHCLPQVKTGRVKVFPRPANLGPPDPNVDDTLSNVSWEDLTGGQGISVINPASDLNRTWRSTADTRYTDGWTNPPEITAVAPFGVFTWAMPLGRIGQSVYALWDTNIHIWDPNGLGWSDTGVDVTVLPRATEESMAYFNGKLFIPAVGDGYDILAESSPGTITVTHITGAITPPDNDPVPTSNPIPILFGVAKQQLYCVTDDVGSGYALASSQDGADNNWFWPYNTAIASFVKLDTGCVPYQLFPFVDATGTNQSLWLSTSHGLLTYDTTNTGWQESQLWNVPPHPDFGKSVAVFRPGEAAWITSGGGDLYKLTANGVVVPASGPGGNGDGLPADRRGSIISMDTDLANLYLLLAKPIDAYTANMTLIAGTGKGWHPLWEGDGVAASSAFSDLLGTPTLFTAVKVAYDTKTDGSVAYYVFWAVGTDMYQMPCRLETYSSRQGREAGIDRFSTTSYIELGEFSGTSLALEKLASHAAVILDDMPPGTGCSVLLEYQTEVDEASTWHTLGTATAAHARTVLCFGRSPDGLWSAGLPFYWIKLRLTLTGAGGTITPIVRSLTLAYLPLPQDAATLTFTIPLPVVVDDETDLTAEQIRDRLEGYVTSREFLQLTWQDRTYRVYAASVTSSAIAPKDAVGSLSLVLIQINTGSDDCLGEI